MELIEISDNVTNCYIYYKKGGEYIPEIEIVEYDPELTYKTITGMEMDIPDIKTQDDSIKTYIIARAVKPLKSKDSVVSYDFVYGKVDFYNLYNNAEYREKFLDLISRKNLDSIIKESCGALPSDFTEEKGFKYKKDMLKDIIEGVFEFSHRSKVTIEEKETITSNKTSISFRDIEGSNKKVKKKKFMDIAEEKRKELLKKLEENGDDDEPKKAEETKLSTPNSLILFYHTGYVAIQFPVYDFYGMETGEYKKGVVSRYSLCYKPRELNSGETRLEPKKYIFESILISDVDDKKLGLEGEYRNKFIEDICIPILKYNDDKRFSISAQEWPYIGAFSPDDKVSLKKLRKAVHEKSFTENFDTSKEKSMEEKYKKMVQDYQINDNDWLLEYFRDLSGRELEGIILLK